MSPFDGTKWALLNLIAPVLMQMRTNRLKNDKRQTRDMK